MRKLFLAAAAGLIAGPALAGGPVVVPDDPVVAVVPAADPGFDWTGFYAGASIGQGEVDGDGSSDTDFYGLQAGYLRDFGNFVLGGELSYTTGDLDDFTDTDYDSTRLKLIGGYGAGRFMPYAFVGVSNASINGPGVDQSDSATLYGIGGRYALGATGRHVIGLEYLVEKANDFDGSGIDVENKEVSLRYDFRF